MKRMFIIPEVFNNTRLGYVGLRCTPGGMTEKLWNKWTFLSLFNGFLFSSFIKVEYVLEGLLAI